MTNKERVLKTIRFEETDRAPFAVLNCCDWCSYDMIWSKVLGKDTLTFASYAATCEKMIRKRLDKIAEAVEKAE